MQARARFAEPRGQGMFRQQRQGAEIAHAPALQRVEHLLAQFLVLARGSQRFSFAAACDIKRIEKNSKRKNTQPFGFLSRGNHGDAAESAGGMHGRIRIGSHTDVALQSHSAHARGQFARHRGGRTVKPLHPIKVEQQTIGMRVLYSWSKRMSNIQQGSVRRLLLHQRALPQDCGGRLRSRLYALRRKFNLRRFLPGAGLCDDHIFFGDSENRSLQLGHSDFHSKQAGFVVQ